MSARAHRSKSIASTFSSISVTVCSVGRQRRQQRQAGDRQLARLPMNGRACSRPQYETSNRGLISTMSAIVCLSFLT